MDSLMQLTRTLFVPTLALALAACKDSGPLDEDLGTEIVQDLFLEGLGPPDWTGGRFAWSHDSREIFFLSGMRFEWADIQAVDIETATTRTLASDHPSAGMFRHSHDGEWLYFYDLTVDYTVEEVLDEHHVYSRVAAEGGTPEILIERVQWSTPYALSPDGDFLAYNSSVGGSLLVFDLDLGTQVDLGVQGKPLRYSPDGSELLVATGGLSIVSVDDGSAVPWTSHGFGDGGFVDTSAGVYWEGNRIEHVWVEAGDGMGEWDHMYAHRLLVTNRSGSDRAVTKEGALDHMGAAAAALSPDGTQAAVWFQDCLPESWHLLYCDERQAVLELIDIASGSISTIGAAQEWAPETMSFSPDGRHLAYVLGASIYVKEVP